MGFFLQFFSDSEFQEMHLSVTNDSDNSIRFYSNPLCFVAGASLMMGGSASSAPYVVSSPYVDLGVLFGYTATGYDLGFQFTNGSLSSGKSTTATNTITTNMGYTMSSNKRGGFQTYLDNVVLPGGQVTDTGQEMASHCARTLVRLL